MTRVLYCHPGAELYGADRMALETIIDLQGRGDDVTVAVPNGGPLVDELRNRSVKVEEIAVPVLRKSLMKPRALFGLLASSARGLMRALKILRARKIDVVYVNTLTQPIWAVAGWLLRRRVLLHVREAETESAPMVRAALCAPAWLASIVVANSNATARFITDSLPLRTPRVSVVYNGKDWSAFGRTSPSEGAHETDIVVVGRLSPRKGQDLVLAAVKHLEGTHPALSVAFAGAVFPGYEWYEEELRDRAAEMGLTARVHFMGFVTDPAVAFAAARIAVVPSRLEPFGTVAAEAMASGIPVVVSGVQGLLEIVEDGETGFVFDADDPESLAIAIKRAIHDAETGGEVADRGRQSVLKRFSRERYAREISDLVHGDSR